MSGLTTRALADVVPLRMGILAEDDHLVPLP